MGFDSLGKEDEVSAKGSMGAGFVGTGEAGVAFDEPQISPACEFAFLSYRRGSQNGNFPGLRGHPLLCGAMIFLMPMRSRKRWNVGDRKL